MINEYYIASAKVRGFTYDNGNEMAKDEDLVWLGYDNGSPRCYLNQGFAHMFQTKEEIIRFWWDWYGKPYWSRLKPNSLEIYRCTIEKIKT